MTRMLSRLFRIPLALMNGVAALGGYLLFGGPVETGAACAIVAGTALMAAAGSALNQVLERELDALMLRTRNRPLPTGELSPKGALLVAAALLVAGGALLLAGGGGAAASVGAVAVVWYLLVYTPLKRRTPFALAVGALCGALAPVIGWCAAGGSPDDFRIIILSGVLYLWQIPHFWLLQRRYADDYRRAGFPVFAAATAGDRATPIFRLWVVALVAGALMLPAFGVVEPTAAPFCAVFFAPLVISSVRRLEPALFATLNLFPLLVTLVLCAAR